MYDDLIRTIVKRCDKAFQSTERSNQKWQWQLISEFMLPNQSGIFEGDDTPGGKKTRRLFDSTAIQANHDLAAAIHSTLTNPATKWSKIRYKNDFLNNEPQALAWLEASNKSIHDHINESNFDTMISKNYQAFTSLGTMALLADELTDDTGRFAGFRFEAFHLSEVAYSENKFGDVDTLYRKFKFTARQAMERWGVKLPEMIIKAAMENPEQEFEFILCIMPRDKKDVKYNDVGLATAKNRPYAGYYIHCKGETVLEETGYYEFPVFVTRWSTMPGEIYGRGPGSIALPDVRTLNRVKELGLQAIAKAVNPPVISTQRNILGNLDMRPGQLTVVRAMDDIREVPTAARFDVTQFAVEDLRNAIKNVFFIDKLFLPPRTETGEMTAFEIDQRLAQMQRVLGPTLSRLNSEFLSPLILRCFKILLRNGVLPEIPPSIKEVGLDIDINFVNQLSRAQQIEELSSVQAWIQQDLAGLAQLDPTVLDILDADATAIFAAKIRSIPEQLVRNIDVIEEIRAQRAQQQEMQLAMQAGTTMADMSSKMAGTTNPGGGQEPQKS